ncbi:metallophosphoesterase family protein [Clostridium tagluense]|uniref:metallophosphoesterase family protein n=1 Tax=Clostridium tagluense TaxID=360422 RepID=UPI001C0B7868|nr:metallophosphoesterase [Clostridium tagluense]MBU3130555.1 metallophosphoesterase [Clostridium tagluense]
MSIIKWLHLSDIHYTFANHETNRMRDLSLKYIKELNIDFNFVIITGDLKYKNQKYGDTLNQYMEMLVDVCGVGKNKIFIVPGNHDVTISKARTKIIEDINEDAKTQDKIDKLEVADYNILISGMDEYFEFIRRFKEKEYPEDKLYCIEEFDNYNIIHINTCLFSGILREDEVVVEEGKLHIDLRKLREVLRPLEKHSKLNIAIGHHSFNCFDENDSSGFENLFYDFDIDIYLNGHTHKPNMLITSNGDGVCTCTCGSGMVDDYSTVGMITSEIDTDSGDGELTFHKWYGDKSEKWDVDPTVTRGSKQGKEKINLNKFKEKNRINEERNNYKHNKKEDGTLHFQIPSNIPQSNHPEVKSNEQYLTFDGLQKYINENTDVQSITTDELPIRTNDRSYSNVGYYFSDQCKGPFVKIVLDDKVVTEIGGNLISQYSQVMDYLKKHEILVECELRDGIFPIEAIEEALINAIVHRDYTIREDVVINITVHIIVISSPGETNLALNELGNGTNPTNPKIATCFERLTKSCNRGYGWKNIIGEYKKSSNKVKIIRSQGEFKVEFPRMLLERGC